MGNESTAAIASRRAVAGAVLVVLALVAACSGSGDGSKADGLVYEPVSSKGTDPFMDSTAVREVADFPSAVNAVAKKAQKEATPASSGGGVVIPGSVPGLYGGSSDESICDAKKLVEFLDSHPAQAKAWAEVEGVSVNDIDGIVSGFTPVILTADTWVTNHGFKDGKATPRQSVLQKGTAVLVDDKGVPRVKCGCGNPLLAPQRSGVDLAAGTGDKWAGYDPQLVTEVEPAKQPIPVFTTTDVQTAQPIQTQPVSAEAGGLIVAVGGDNRSSIVVSTDGTTWDEVFTGGNALSGVGFGDGHWVAVGSQGTVYGSDDGRTWKQVTTLPDSLYDVAHADGKWIGVGSGSENDGVVYRSDDGTTWKKVASIPSGQGEASNSYLSSVAHGPAGWMATMQTAGSTSSTQTDVFRSDDGTTWKRLPVVDSGTGNETALATAEVAYGDGAYKLLGSGEDVGSAGVLSSADGKSWTWTAQVPQQPLTSPYWDGSRWLALTVGEGTQLATSPDAVNWTIAASLPNLATDVAASGATSPVAAPAPKSSGADLSGFDFANFTVPGGCGGQEDIVLTGGKYEDPRGFAYAGGATLNQPVQTADVDGDGVKEALVELVCSAGGNSATTVVTVFKAGESGPERIGAPLTGSLADGPVPDGPVDLHTPEYSPSDARCWSSAEKVTTYTYDGNAFQVTNTVVLPND